MGNLSNRKKIEDLIIKTVESLTDKENVKKQVTKTVEEHGDKGGSLVFILIFAIIIIILSLVFIIYNVGRNKNKI